MKPSKRLNPRTRKRVRNVALILGVNLAILLLLEGLCGLFLPHEPHAINFQSYPDYVYRMHPNDSRTGRIFPDEVTPEFFPVQYRTNDRGFRGAPFSTEKDPGRVRILAMGDSHTYGEGVEEDRIYPVRVERLLNRAAGKERFEVINLGVSGYSSVQGLLLLEKEGIPLSPDYVIVAYGSNDQSDMLLGVHRDLTDRDVLALLDRSRKLPPGFLAWITKTNLYRALKRAVLLTGDRLGDLLGRSDKALLRVPVSDYRRNLVRFRELADENGFRVIFLNIGNFGNDYDRVMGETARREGVPFLHAVHAFQMRLSDMRSGKRYAELLAPYREMLGETLESRLYDEGAMYYTVDGGHPNAVGHEIIAEELASILLSLEGQGP